jgi:hypothetical protein
MASNPYDPPRTDAPSDELARVEADIARTRDRVSRSVSALRQAMVDRTDWREWVRRRPGVFLAGAFVLGLAWGLRRPSSLNRRARHARRIGPWR